MKRAAFLSALLLSSLTSPGQNASQPQSLNFRPASDSTACPVVMKATQRASDYLLAARNGQRTIGPGQRINITLLDTRSSKITAAEMRVYGLTARNHMMHAESGSDPDATRSLSARFTLNPDGTVSADLALSGFTSITSIDLVSLAYADGTTWRVSSDSVCRVAPDPLMLISHR